MTLKVNCACGAKFTAKDELAGKQVKCPKCGGQLSVPAKSAASQPIRVTCQCGKSFAAKPKLAGQQVTCPSCQHPLQVPSNVVSELPPLTEPASPWDLQVDANQAAGLDSMSFPGPAGPQFGSANPPFSGGPQQQLLTKPASAGKKRSKFRGGMNALKTGFLVAAAILVAIARMFSCSAAPDNQSMAFNTPEKVFQEFREAIIAEDWGKAAGLFTLDESRRQSSGYLVILSVFANNDEEAAAILEKHGLDPNEVVKQLAPARTGGPEFRASMTAFLRRIRSHSAFVADCWRWKAARGDSSAFAYVLEAELVDLRLNSRNLLGADRATATVRAQVDGQTREFDWVFLRPKNYRPNYWQIAGKND